MRKIFTLFASLFIIALQLCADESTYLNFTAVNGPAKVRLDKTGNPDTIRLQYSINNCATWLDYTIGQDIQLASGEKVYFKATNRNGSFCPGPNVDDEYYYNYHYFSMQGMIAADGNIMSLLDATMTQTSVPEYAFYSLFNSPGLLDYGCSIIQAPALPATTLAEGCYRGMFRNCISLTQAPALPATTLADSCYMGMFEGCTSMTQAPALPATTLADYCYAFMFEGCTSLTQAPALPATTLAYACYAFMFYGCTSLTQAPDLPATTLAYLCYGGMFNGCTSLTQAPALPATTLYISCYISMFIGCTSLTNVPELPATTLADACYAFMFNGCTSLIVNTQAPGKAWKIPERVVPGINWNVGMFAGTGGTFTGNPIMGVTYYIASDTTTTGTENVNIAEYNVFSNNGHIFVNGAMGASVGVYDVNGQLIAMTKEADETHEFNVGVAGIYFVRINDNESVKVVVR